MLHLIEKAEVDIYEVPISQITDQYIKILEEAKQMELEIASEFLVMAATLIALKSKMLLPKPDLVEDELSFWNEEEMDPRTELVERLLEYKRYKRLGDVLERREEERNQVYTRDPIDLSPYTKEISPVEGLTVDDLLQSFIEMMQHRTPPEPVTEMVREEISVSARMVEIMSELEQVGHLRFSQLLIWTEVTKERVITTFLALLELMKTKQVICQQDVLFGDLVIRPFLAEMNL
ncbi:segregation and condensation protein A [Polycladospora coralii]|uniref:segregation and condensation protein A n=1 Tax=Polycladospora coralii TaxID=2771432 RepID=UPI001CD138C2|nr:segregation/condensation protein A [Polycladospora coralii]